MLTRWPVAPGSVSGVPTPTRERTPYWASVSMNSSAAERNVSVP
jgi:hypothetical protein